MAASGSDTVTRTNDELRSHGSGVSNEAILLQAVKVIDGPTRVASRARGYPSKRQRPPRTDAHCQNMLPVRYCIQSQIMGVLMIMMITGMIARS